MLVAKPVDTNPKYPLLAIPSCSRWTGLSLQGMSSTMRPRKSKDSVYPGVPALFLNLCKTVSALAVHGVAGRTIPDDDLSCETVCH